MYSRLKSLHKGTVSATESAVGGAVALVLVALAREAFGKAVTIEEAGAAVLIGAAALSQVSATVRNWIKHRGKGCAR